MATRCRCAARVWCGRDGEIRTRGLSAPNAARYQAALHPDGVTLFVVRAVVVKMCAWRDSNSQPPAPEAGALSVELQTQERVHGQRVGRASQRCGVG